MLASYNEEVDRVALRHAPQNASYTSPGIQKENLHIFSSKIRKINVSLTTGHNTKIVLNAGNGDCVLQTGPLVYGGNILKQLPSYYKLVTPIYGAYFLFLIALIVGGTWACCKFRKRKRHNGIPYQELEMGLPEAASAVNVDTAEGWDQGWDDDWDEEKAVKSPGGRHVGSVSANGLTSRTSNRDGWENDWNGVIFRLRVDFMSYKSPLSLSLLLKRSSLVRVDDDESNSGDEAQPLSVVVPEVAVGSSSRDPSRFDLPLLKIKDDGDLAAFI
ncbi:hypothetical protein F0562_017827 [Nyssa sinensis]|uniref:DUF7356 domain-containing protein n=1 Tax=Nyssa sinensis TaxID=561372 RepID=A0A5J4ZFV6_9ASTE|nr:hypothetical protein F0562_017827 [Nyssa sinensis]